MTTIRKKVVGEISGKTMVQKRLAGPAPSIAAASISDFGIACMHERKNQRIVADLLPGGGDHQQDIAWLPFR